VVVAFVDMNNVIRLQEMIRDGQRKLESERSAKTLLDTKRKALENERAKLVELVFSITSMFKCNCEENF